MRPLVKSQKVRRWAGCHVANEHITTVLGSAANHKVQHGPPPKSFKGVLHSPLLAYLTPPFFSLFTFFLTSPNMQRRQAGLLALLVIVCALFMGLQTVKAAEDKEAYGTGM